MPCRLSAGIFSANRAARCALKTMLTQEFALEFADEWIAAWNSHDLDRVLRHYAADAELTSPCGNDADAITIR